LFLRLAQLEAGDMGVIEIGGDAPLEPCADAVR
jgi:hypothetical protein